MPPRLQSAISYLELFAQTFLLHLRTFAFGVPTQPELVYRLCDSSPAEGAANNAQSTAWPLAIFLKNLTMWSNLLHTRVIINHVAGEESV